MQVLGNTVTIVLYTIFLNFVPVAIGLEHSRRIKREEKAKVVAAVWGKELIQISCRSSYFEPE